MCFANGLSKETKGSIKLSAFAQDLYQVFGISPSGHLLAWGSPLDGVVCVGSGYGFAQSISPTQS